MKSNELRIGNWVLVHGKEFRVAPADISYHHTLKEGHTIQHYPIPLTEEWLIRFGLWVKEYDNKSKCDLWVRRVNTINDALRLDYVNDKGENCWEFYVYNISGQRVGCSLIKYVHQLQNLFFALTGEELKIK